MKRTNPESRTMPTIIDIKFCLNKKGEPIVGIDCYAESENLSKSLLPNLGNFDDFSDSTPEDCSLRQTLNKASPKDSVFPASELQIQQCKEIASGKAYVKSSVYYVLPNRAHGLLNWIGCFLRYLGRIRNLVQSMHIKKQYKTMTGFLIGAKDIQSLEEYANEKKCLIKSRDDMFEFSWDITGKIGDMLRDDDRYLKSLSSLQAIVICSVNSLTHNGNYRFFYQLIEYKNRFKILCAEVYGKSSYAVGEICDSLLDPKLSKEARSLLLKKYIRSWIDQDEQWLIPHMLSGINDRLKMNLLDQVIGQKSYDCGFVFVYPEGVYTKTHRQWFFIRDIPDADLIIDAEGHLLITNVSNNQTYKDNYASGKELDDQFKNDMREFGEKSGLWLAHDIDFHNDKIKLSIESSNKMIDLGFGLFSFDLVKKSINRERLLYFFKHSSDGTGKTNINDLPEEVLQQIVNFV